MMPSIFSILQILGALCLFVFGMKIMSEGVQKLGSDQLRLALRSMTHNRYFGLLFGFIITAILQSSSATTVMTISLVNAGLLSLFESAGILMGANVGTTMTAWIVSLAGFQFQISALSLPLIAIGLPMIFIKRKKWRFLGEVLVGFGILFLGLEELKTAVPDLNANIRLHEFIGGFTNLGILSTLIFVVIGILLTIVIQSSSAVMALTMVLCANQVIPLSLAAAMVLGANIGTTITAELAALVGNIHAKRSARIHTLFNILGVTWMIFMMPLFLRAIDYSMVHWAGAASPFDNVQSMSTALATFHTIFNFINAAVFIWFIPFLINLATRMIPSSKTQDEEFKLKFLGSGFVNTPDLAMAEAKKEIQNLGKLLERLLGNVSHLLFENPRDRERIIEKIKNREHITDNVEKQIIDFLVQTSEASISKEGATRIQILLSMVNEMERIGDICYEMTLTNEKIMQLGANITNNVRDKIKELFEMVQQQLKLTNANINKRFVEVSIKDVQALEHYINDLRTDLQKLVFDSIDRKIISPAEGIHYMNIINNVEKLGDHLYKINETMTRVKSK